MGRSARFQVHKSSVTGTGLTGTGLTGTGLTGTGLTGAVFLVLTLLSGLALHTGSLAPAAGAHSELLGSSPAPGQRYAPPLVRIELQFDETVTFPDIELTTPDGRKISGLLSSPRAGNIRVTLAEPDQTRGAWALSWAVQSPDGDPTEGEFTFAISDDGAALTALPETLIATGGSPDDHPAEPRSPLFFAALGITIALGAVLIWIGFDALGNRIRANNAADNNPADNNPADNNPAEQ